MKTLHLTSVSIFLTLLLFAFNTKAQNNSKVTIEDTKSTTYTRVRNKVIELQGEYTKQLEKLNKPDYTNPVRTSKLTKKSHEAIILKSNKILYFIQQSGLQEKCEEINRLNKSIDEYNSDWCLGIDQKVSYLQEIKVWADETMKKQVSEHAVENSNKSQHDRKIKELDDEINDLDAILEADNAVLDLYEQENKTTSLDEFLTTQTTKSNAQPGDFLDQPQKGNNRSGDFLDNSTDNQNPEDFLSGPDETTTSDFNIDYKNGMHGVIDSKGNILIPYKEWSIIEYKTGIAKVHKPIQSYRCPAWTYSVDIPSISAYLEGFVGDDGKFIDGSTVKFNAITLNTIYLTSSKTRSSFRSSYEYEAYLRKGKEAKRRREKKKKICKQQENQWKKSIIAKYR